MIDAGRRGSRRQLDCLPTLDVAACESFAGVARRVVRHPDGAVAEHGEHERVVPARGDDLRRLARRRVGVDREQLPVDCCRVVLALVVQQVTDPDEESTVAEREVASVREVGATRTEPHQARGAGRDLAGHEASVRAGPGHERPARGVDRDAEQTSLPIRPHREPSNRRRD